MTLEAIIQLIANNGFAIAVAIYCLVYLNNSMKNMNDILIEIKTILADHKEKNEKEDGE